MSLLQFEHVTGKTVYINPQRVAYVIPREAGRVTICFSGVGDDYVVVKGEVDAVQGQISSAIAS